MGGEVEEPRHLSQMTPPYFQSSDEWSDRFFEAYFDENPVNATFIGVHEHDGRFPDLSRTAVDTHLGRLKELLAEASAASVQSTPLSAMNRRISTGYLRTRIWEHESGYFLNNPSIHTGEAVFGLMSLLLADYAPIEERVAALDTRMAALPTYLDQAKSYLNTAPIEWTRRALRECESGLTFLREGLERVDYPAIKDVTTSRSIAVGAFEAFSSFLETELSARPSVATGCGGEAFDLYLKEAHFLDLSADEVAEYARSEMEQARAWLDGAAPDFGGGDSAEILESLLDLHPDVEGYLGRYEEIWQAMRAVAVERELLTWPDAPIRYVPRPEWARDAAPGLYFLFYRSPAAFARPEVHEYLVTPIEATLPETERHALLRAHNDSVIKLNHVVHHGGIGHHVQNWHAFRSPLPMGRVAAVDCASRIAMPGGATMAEGWACYATGLMAEAGGLTPAEQYAEHSARVRMCARTIVDVDFHHGRMTLEQASAFYEEEAGMTPASADAEAVKNSMFPAAALIYLMGTDQIRDLRGDVMRLQGDSFKLRDFHDDFLSYGSIPVKLIADEVKRRAAAGLPLNAHAPLTEDGASTEAGAGTAAEAGTEDGAGDD